jgi:hypothetical protein
MENRSPATNELIAQAKAATEKAKDGLLTMFEAVSEARLNWSPSPTARTPVWLVAHCGAANNAFATILRGEPWLMPHNPTERDAIIRAGGQEVTTRAEAIRSIEDSTTAILQALDAITDDLAQGVPESPFGAIPYTFWMTATVSHTEYHRCQLAYLQTIWGDLQDH